MQQNIKKAIKEEFIDLLQKKPIHKISIKNICERVQINRSTFYYYFIDIYDVLEQIEKDWLDHFEKLILSSHSMNLKDIFIIILDDITINGTRYKIVSSLKENKIFHSDFINLYYHYYLTQDSNLQISYKQKWTFYFAVSGCIEIINQWLKEGQQEDVNELASFLSQIFETTVNDYSD